MNIDRINISNGAIDRSQQSQGTEDARSTKQSRSGAKDDAVSLSSTAKNVARISEMVEQSRADRLDQVRDAIANGTYRVSGEDIARSLIKLNER